MYYFHSKNALVYTNLLVLAAGVLNVISKYINAYETIMVGRFVTGIFCGFFTGILPIYLYEISPQSLRGLTGTMNQLNIVVGILATNILGLPQLFGSAEMWPILVGIVFVPVLAHVLLLTGVESPKYLFLKLNDRDKAKKALIRLRGGNKLALVHNELACLEEESELLVAQTLFKWSDFLKKNYLLRPLIVTIVIQMSQQFSGINAVIFYSTSIFNNAGFDHNTSVYCTISLGFVQVIMTFICVVIIDRVGRRILLLIGMMGMCVSAFGLATFSVLATRVKIVNLRLFAVTCIPKFFVFQDSNLIYLNYLTVFFSIFYVIFFAIGPGK